jgi:UDP-glucose 4-epimerase
MITAAADAGHVLVTGGAGYIGSHCVRRLMESGFKVVVVDNLCTGNRWAVPEQVPFVNCNAGDGAAVGEVIQKHGVTAVLHFAGYIVVPESVKDPLKYYENNVCASRNLAEACVRNGVERFIFSSSAAVYGDPVISPTPESAPPAPINPYGTSKLITEWMLRDVAASSALRYVALRYFNVAGARADGSLGQATPDATHLVKIAAEAACGNRPGVSIYGTDYATRDGTCVRDYIHVDDLADAHIAALRHLASGRASGVYNCGYGKGFTVREVLDTMREVSGTRFEVVEAGRRKGDPAALVADATAIGRDFGWQPRLDDIRVICESAYRWERKLHDHRASSKGNRPK